MTRVTIARLARIAFWCAAAFAYVMAIIPGGEPGITFSNDKANHVLAFFTLAMLARIGWTRGSAVIITALLIAFGGFIEISQAMPLVHRDAEWGDLLADTIAVLVGMIVASTMLAVLRRRRPPRGSGS